MTLKTDDDQMPDRPTDLIRFLDLSLNPSILRDRFTSASRGRIGRESDGLYPEVSRTKLAKLVGKSVGGITGVLNGRTKPTLELAGMIAMAVGVTIDELWVRLEEKQRERLMALGAQVGSSAQRTKSKGKAETRTTR